MPYNIARKQEGWDQWTGKKPEKRLKPRTGRWSWKGSEPESDRNLDSEKDQSRMQERKLRTGRKSGSSWKIGQVPWNQVRNQNEPWMAFWQSSSKQASDENDQRMIDVNEKKREEAEEKSWVESVEREVERMLDIKNTQKWPLIVDDRSLWRKTKIAKWSNQGSFHFWKAAACQILYNQIYWQNRRYQLYYTSAEAMSRMHEVP